MITHTNKHCYGCSKHKRYASDCSIKHCAFRLPNDGQCPCTDCVIKVMCQKQCADWLSFRDDVFPIIIENFKKELLS